MYLHKYKYIRQGHLMYICLLNSHLNKNVVLLQFLIKNFPFLTFPIRFFLIRLGRKEKYFN